MDSPDEAISTPTTSLASNEAQPPPSVRFKDTEELYRVVKQISGDFLSVQNVPLAVFEQILQDRRRFRIRRYHADKKLLIITIPTRLHEALHLNLFRELDYQLMPNLIRWWSPIGSTTFRPQGHPGGDGGEGDSCGGPIPARYHKDGWPTLIIAAGVSETMAELRNDMAWWFSASDHQVKIILLTKFDHLRDCIVIERWEEEIQTRLGATMTRRAAGAVRPVCRQSITIRRNPATDTYHITRSALLLSFRLLFLRDPGPQEGDFIISIANLEAYARKVWAVV